ncbi:MAG: M24 family metallopeptidase [Ktedonobacterales bacterium]
MSDFAPRRAEVEAKLARLRERMRERRLELVVLTETPNVTWLTAGANTNIILNTDRSGISISVTMDHATILANTIEAPRLEAEESIRALGLEIEAPVWWETGEALSALAKSGPKPAASDGGRLGPDFADISQDLQALRTSLFPTEIDRLRAAADCATLAMRGTIAELTPGMTELAIAAELALHTIREGGQVVVNLVASDQRISQFRHPLPTDKTVERYVMLVLCASVGGLTAAVTRLLYFGKLPAELDAKARIVAEIDARLILTTQAGRTLGDQFSCAEEAYREAGYPMAIREHHQGGSIGYLSREVLAQPDDPTRMEVSQAFAWNPSLAGVKSEDTILLTPNGPEVLTSWPEWPSAAFSFEGRSLNRPAILVR